MTDIMKLVKDLWKNAQDLLLFTRNVNVLRLYTTLGQVRHCKAALVMETKVRELLHREMDTCTIIWVVVVQLGAPG